MLPSHLHMCARREYAHASMLPSHHHTPPPAPTPSHYWLVAFATCPSAHRSGRGPSSLPAATIASGASRLCSRGMPTLSAMEGGRFGGRAGGWAGLPKMGLMWCKMCALSSEGAGKMCLFELCMAARSRFISSALQAVARQPGPPNALPQRRALEQIRQGAWAGGLQGANPCLRLIAGCADLQQCLVAHSGLRMILTGAWLV